MRICIYQPRISYYTGGGEIYPFQNAKYFSRLGHDVTILTTKSKYIKESNYFQNFKIENPYIKFEYIKLNDDYRYIYEEEPGINWERWDKESLFVSRLAHDYIRKNKFDIISIHNVLDLIAVPMEDKRVLHLHGSPEKMNYMCKLLLEKEKNIIAVSKNVAEKWKKLGVESDMKIVTNAIDNNVFKNDENIVRSNDLLFVGRLIPIKGIQNILEALKILKDEYFLTLNLIIIGKGPYKDNLVNLAKKLNIESQVNFKGLVSQEELIYNYQCAKVAVLPSHSKEGIMTTLLEAASCKTPAITTFGTSMVEFAGDNKNALLVHPNDSNDLAEKIYKIITDNKLNEQISINAYQEVLKKYTWLNKTKELIRVYQDMVDNE